MTADAQAVAFVIVLVAAVVAVLAGSVIVQARWRRTLDTPPVTGYTGPERRAETMTKYVRPGKIRRPVDKWDIREDVDA